MAGGGGLAECRTSALPHFLPRDVQGVARALLRRPALLPTALLRLRCLVWVDSTSCSSDDADDPYFMTAVSRLTPRARPADQPRTASIVPPRASADGWDGAERPAHEAGLIACAARAADQLLPDPLAGRSCSRCSTGWCAAAPPAAPQRPPASHAAARLAPDRPGTPHGEGARKLLATRAHHHLAQSLPRCAGTLQLNARRLGSLPPPAAPASLGTPVEATGRGHPLSSL